MNFESSFSCTFCWHTRIQFTAEYALTSQHIITPLRSKSIDMWNRSHWSDFIKICIITCFAHYTSRFNWYSNSPLVIIQSYFKIPMLIATVKHLCNLALLSVHALKRLVHEKKIETLFSHSTNIMQDARHKWLIDQLRAEYVVSGIFRAIKDNRNCCDVRSKKIQLITTVLWGQFLIIAWSL